MCESEESESVVVVLNDARVDGASAERLRAFAAQGGGVLLILGGRSSWPASAADVLPGARIVGRDRVGDFRADFPRSELQSAAMG